MNHFLKSMKPLFFFLANRERLPFILVRQELDIMFYGLSNLIEHCQLSFIVIWTSDAALKMLFFKPECYVQSRFEGI